MENIQKAAPEDPKRPDFIRNIADVIIVKMETI